MDIFLSVVGLLVLLVCFWLCMASFSVCSLLACLSFCFVSCPYIRSYRFPGMFRIRSGAWHAKSAAALRCRSFPNRFAATGATGAISIRWPAQNHLRYRTVAWKTIHSPGGSIWSIGFGTGLAVRRRISSLGPISGPNNPKWIESDIGFDGWKFPISEPQGTCHTDGPSGPVLGL